MGRLSLLPLVALGLVAACGDWVGGGDDDGSGNVDARGPDYTYVVSDVDLPTTAAEAQDLGLDIDGRANDGIDNRLGAVLETLVASRDIDPDAALDGAIGRGEIIALVSVNASDLVTASGVGFRLFEGANIGPSTFEATAFDNNVAAGRIVNGRYTGQAALLTVRLGAIDGVPITLTLHDAKVQLDAMTLDTWGRGTIGGAIAANDRTQLSVALAAITGIDGATAAAAVEGEPLDVDFDGDGTNDALSVGLGLQGAVAWFTPVR
jgi:hypothetical protein